MEPRPLYPEHQSPTSDTGAGTTIRDGHTSESAAPEQSRAATSDHAPGAQVMTVLGDRFLVEHIHRVLDQGGIAAHRSFCDTLLPYLQGLVALLPELVQGDETQHLAVERVRTLISAAEQRGIAPSRSLAEGMSLYDRVQQELVSHLSEQDRGLALAAARFGRVLLELQRDVPVNASAARVPEVAVDHLDAQTGLATPPYFKERFGEEILRAQRLDRELALVLVNIAHPHNTPGAHESDTLLHAVAAALLAQTRGFDLVTRLEKGTFSVLLPETNRAGAAAVLSRLRRGSEESTLHNVPMQFTVGIAVYPRDGKTVHDLMQHADSVLNQRKHDT